MKSPRSIANQRPRMANAPTQERSGAPLFSSEVDFGREICGELHAASQREWLVTNGIGGFASGTVAGLLTRRYHGLLFAALKPPLSRTLLVTKLDETASYNGNIYSLFTNSWASGSIEPHGYRHIERFRLEGTTPVWTFAIVDALLEKRIWMQQGDNTTYVAYELVRASHPLRLSLKALVNYRDYHAITHAGDWRMRIERVPHGLMVLAFDGAAPFYILTGAPNCDPAHDWYHNFDLRVERFRGLEDREDHLFAGEFELSLEPGESASMVLSVEATPNLDVRSARASRQAHEQRLLEQWTTAQPEAASQSPAWVQQLVLAADQFIVKRPLADNPDARSIIAGYHWFGDWGRDTMVTLPGLTLATGRIDVAKKILRTFARFLDRGMLPNVFRDLGTTPEYNTVDAALWFFEAVRQTIEAEVPGRENDFLQEMYPLLAETIDWHIRGSRYNIHVDPADGLLFAGEPGVQLTWMDAKIGDWVVTPRIGKPVEVNALWYNALITMAQFGRRLGLPTDSYELMSRLVHASFQRFWNDSAQSCFDVIDGPDGNDASLRPNQIFAVALPASPLTPQQQRAVIDACATSLLTSHGLRSLARTHLQYRGQYGGAQRDRDAAYHQGAVWGWLLGPFALAHLRVYKDLLFAASLLEPMRHHLKVHGLGTASEIFEGEPPFKPRGCIAQAWTVAELLRTWHAITLFQADLQPNPAMPHAEKQVGPSSSKASSTEISESKGEPSSCAAADQNE